MKKALIGFAVLVVFGVYSLGMRHQKPVIGKPASLSNTPTSSSSNTTTSGSTGTNSSHSYKDGTYTGSVADAYYGSVQVSVSIASGKITDVTFLQYPNSHQTSVIINQQAMPYLKQEAIQAQSSTVQVISGATFTSQAFQQSLGAALSQA